jgi:hypothetical protein
VAVDAAERLKDENGSCIQDAAVKAAPGPLSASFRSTHSLGDCEPLPLPSEDGRSEAVNEHINADGRTSASADKR